MITIDNVTKLYDKKIVFSNLSTIFSDNGVTLILGLNGSGKTTLLNMINGLIKIDTGIVLIDDLKASSKISKKKVVYIPSDFYLPEYMTGKEYCEFIFSIYKEFNKTMYTFLLNLFDFEKEIENIIESYSFGMKKKLQIIASFSLNTKYIFADELFSGLDLETQILLNELIISIKDTKKIVLVTHSLDIIKKYPEDVRILSKGCFIKMSDSESVEEYLVEVGNMNGKINSIKKFKNYN